MATDYADQAERIRQAHDRQLDRIRARYARKEITAELRDTLISRNLVDTRTQLAQLRDAEHTARAERRQTLERRLFAPDSSDGNDPATRAAAFRQARAEAAEVGDERAIREELRKAVRAGDTLMQKALFERAHDIAMTTESQALAGVVVSYINEVQPGVADDYRELLDQAREDRSTGARFAREAAFLMPTPREVEAYPDHRLTQLADDPRFAEVK